MDSLVSSFVNNILVEDRYLLIIDGLLTTITITVLSVLFGVFLGSIICMLRMSKNRLFSGLARAYISILRGTPLLVLLMLIFYVVFASVDIDPVLVAVIAFGLNFGAYSSEIFRNGINSVPKGQTEAGLSMGFSEYQTFIHIILPQALKRIIPVLKGEIITLLKTTSIVGYIAVQDLTKASDLIRARTFDPFFPLVLIAIIYFLLSKLLTVLLDFAGNHLIHGGSK